LFIIFTFLHHLVFLAINFFIFLNLDIINFILFHFLNDLTNFEMITIFISNFIYQYFFLILFIKIVFLSMSIYSNSLILISIDFNLN